MKSDQILKLQQEESHPLLLQYQKAIELLEEVNKKLIKEKRKRRFWQEKVRAIIRCQLFRKYEEEQIQLNIIKDTYDMLRCDVDQGLLNMKLRGNLPPGIEIHTNDQQILNTKGGNGNKENQNNHGKGASTPLKIKISDNSKKIKKKEAKKHKNDDEDIIVFPLMCGTGNKQNNKIGDTTTTKTKNEKQASTKKQKVKPKQAQGQGQQQNQPTLSQTTHHSQSLSKKQRTLAIDQFLQESIRQAKESIKNSGILPVDKANIESNNLAEQDQKSKHLIEICDENSNQSVVIQGSSQRVQQLSQQQIPIIYNQFPVTNNYNK